MVKTNIDLRVGRVIKIFVVMNFEGWAVFSAVANNKKNLQNVLWAVYFIQKQELCVFGTAVVIQVR